MGFEYHGRLMRANTTCFALCHLCSLYVVVALQKYPAEHQVPSRNDAIEMHGKIEHNFVPCADRQKVTVTQSLQWSEPVENIQGLDTEAYGIP